MERNVVNVSTGSPTLNEVEILNSAITRYFKPALESPPLNKDESLILSALNIFFHGVNKER